MLLLRSPGSAECKAVGQTIVIKIRDGWVEVDGSRDGVEERDTILVGDFYKVGTKMTPHFRDRIDVFGLRNSTIDPDSSDRDEQ